MGSVSKVKKEESARGGSARAAFVKENQTCCFRFINWIKLPGGHTNKKFVATGNLSNNSTEVYSSLSSSVNINDNPVARSLYGSNPPSRNISLRGVEAMPSHQENIESENNDPPKPPTSLPGFSSKDTSPEKTSYRFEPGHSATPGKIRNPKQLQSLRSSLITYGNKKEQTYALKSIIMDRCSSAEFRDELKNEVEILKSLDHPNIVRAIETFEYHNRMCKYFAFGSQCHHSEMKNCNEVFREENIFEIKWTHLI